MAGGSKLRTKASVFQLFRAVAAVFRRLFSHAFAHVSAADQGAEI